MGYLLYYTIVPYHAYQAVLYLLISWPLIIYSVFWIFGDTQYNRRLSTMSVTDVNFEFLVHNKQRGASLKEASKYFPYLDSLLFCSVHYATLPFCHSTILPFRHSAIPPFRHSAILPSCHSAILPFRHSAIPPSRHSTILPFHHSAPIRNNAMYVSQEVLRIVVTLVFGGLRSNRYVPSPQAK